ncbi:FAD/NAD(P)-binding protein [Magnetospira sp. QH-2]|uniref:FAD/NAD(P)-binding protein n=1 Tax=Magnetospira sp. (strain QH-2) TaxID=1288970 RepID=UPI0003E80C6F|nr:FAD/NAD(P)-binding protein [Magnetospira sp. QH-2]CCQ74983.1 putative oxidoreductase FAD/NAD(P)-binding domain protein [Magnetospira sp. QH-2]
MTATALAKDPMLTVPFRVERRRKELSDTFTLELRPEGGRFLFDPGQFNMLYVFGVGEIPISISGNPADPSLLVHTIRGVGTVSDALRHLNTGDQVGVRGPYGTAWPVKEAEGHDLLLVAGGIGLAPLRPTIYHVLTNRARYGKVVILYGARTPEDVLFLKELEKWRSRFDLSVEVTVDRATGKWGGRVGVVTKLIERAGFDPHETMAMVCGPEVMMRFAIQSLEARGVSAHRIYVSMERNMKCAVGFCGHCQLGGHFVCKDGPVFPFDRIRDIFPIREL